MSRTQYIVGLVTLSLALCTTSSYAKELRALIVGVSEYPNLPKALQLAGPRNDAARMRDVLLQRGFSPQQVTVLADGVTDAALPTRRNILAELERLATDAAKDDFVFLYFAGHGSQQPADRRTAEGRAEADGLYEIFLPRDVGKWSGSVGSVENALVKTELRDAVDRILAKGAFVWGVFDSCHSATLVRGANNTDVRYRYVTPKTLGIPAGVLEEAARNASKTSAIPTLESPIITTTQHENAGGSVFFYATQSSEAAPEMVLPQGNADARYFGLFSYTVMDALEMGLPMTYQQMAQYVLTRYGAMNETRVTPLFSGTALEKPVLFQDSPRVRQWKIERRNDIIVQAGALARLSEGAVVAVMADPLDKNEAAVGYLKLTQVGLASSVAAPIAFNGKAALRSQDIPAQSFARAVYTPPQYTLRVSVDAKDCNEGCIANEVVDALRASKAGVSGTVIQWVDAPATGDVMLKLLPDRILLLSPSLQGVDCVAASGHCEQGTTLLLNPTLHSLDGGLREKLTDSLRVIARATNLLRIASRLTDTGDQNSHLVMTLKLSGKDGREIPFRKEQVPDLHVGDRIHVSLTNKGTAAVDVTLLYVDARYGINLLFPNKPGASNRLEPRATQELGIEMTEGALGIERLLSIAVEAAKTQERADFSFLAQPALARLRSAETDQDVMAFMDAGYSVYTTRGDKMTPQAPSSRTSMQVFTLHVAH